MDEYVSFGFEPSASAETCTWHVKANRMAQVFAPSNPKLPGIGTGRQCAFVRNCRYVLLLIHC